MNYPNIELLLLSVCAIGLVMCLVGILTSLRCVQRILEKILNLFDL